MFPETVETESLVLRPLSADHVDVFALYDRFVAGTEGTAEVFEYVPQEPFETVKDAHEMLADAAAEWDDRESAKYAAFRYDPTEGETLVGLAGLSIDWDRRTGMPGVILARPFWGRGYAGECARALAGLAFERLDLELFALAYDGDNERSRRAIEKVIEALGGQHDGVLRNWTVLDGEVLDGHRYTVSREEYRDAVGEG